MNDESQIHVPPSFVDLFVPPGRLRPTESREHIAARYGFCEDLAQMLTETAKTMEFRLGISESDVLERMDRGLQDEATGVDAREGRWVLRRLAELLGWPDPGPAPAAGEAAPADEAGGDEDPAGGHPA